MMRSTARPSNRSPTTLTSEYKHCQEENCLPCFMDTRAGGRLPTAGVWSPGAQMLGIC